MGPMEMVVAIVFIGCGAGVVGRALSMMQAGMSRRNREQDQALLAEMQALRGEVQQLKQQHADEILSFDTTVDRLERRLQFVEGRGQLPSESTAGSSEASTSLTARG